MWTLPPLHRFTVWDLCRLYWRIFLWLLLCMVGADEMYREAHGIQEDSMIKTKGTESTRRRWRARLPPFSVQEGLVWALLLSVATSFVVSRMESEVETARLAYAALDQSPPPPIMGPFPDPALTLASLVESAAYCAKAILVAVTITVLAAVVLSATLGPPLLLSWALALHTLSPSYRARTHPAWLVPPTLLLSLLSPQHRVWLSTALLVLYAAGWWGDSAERQEEEREWERRWASSRATERASTALGVRRTVDKEPTRDWARQRWD